MFEAKDLHRRWSRHKQFESLQSSAVVQKEIAYLKSVTDWEDKPTSDSKKTPREDDFVPLDATRQKKRPENWFDYVAALAGATQGWAIDKGGIKTLYFSEGKLTSIEKVDGNKLNADEVAPPLSEWLLLAIIPILGFVIPWGIVKTVAWIILGFRSTT